MEETSNPSEASISVSGKSKQQKENQAAMSLDPYKNPLFLHSADNSGINLVSDRLTGEQNFSIWKRSIMMGLNAKNKLGFIDGTLAKPRDGHPDSDTWSRCNDTVWSLVRRFDQPQKYKPFISRCVVKGNLEIGSLREVDVKSGLPATKSTERLELLDDDEHILSIRIIGGDHRLKNYSSIISLHPETIEGRPGTLVVESFVVDVPEGNTNDETCYFVEALIKCNLKSLADVSERLAVQDRTEPIKTI